MSEEVLKSTEIKGIHIESNPSRCIVHENLYLYVSDAGTIYSFDTLTLKNTKLPALDKNITGNIISIAVSPSNTIAAAGLDSGSIQLFDLKANKLLKALVKAIEGPVICCDFLNDSVLIIGTENNSLHTIKISTNIFTTTVKESKLTTLDSPLREIQSPPIYRISDSVTCIGTAFQDLISIACIDSFIIASITNEYKVISEHQLTKFVSTQYLSSPKSLLYAVCEKKKIQIFSINENFEEKVEYSHDLDLDPIFIGFMSDYIVAVISKNFHVSLIYFAEDKIFDQALPVIGIPNQTRGAFSVLGDGKFFSYILRSFKDQMEELRSTGNAEEIIAFCKKAKSGDPSAIVGLPMNSAQRSVIIERAISNTIDESARTKLENGANPEEVANELMQLSSDLGMKDWIINRGVQIFADFDQTKLIIKSIIEHDIDGNLFGYDSNFVRLLLKDDLEGVNIADFALKLPRKVASPEILLEYALRTSNFKMMANVLEKRVHSVSQALSVWAKAGNASEVSDMLIRLIKRGGNEAKEVIGWTFGILQNRYPVVELLIKGENPTGALEQIFDYLEKFGYPYSTSDFLSILGISLRAVQNPDKRVIELFENLILTKRAPLTNAVLPFVFERVFRERENHENGEQILLQALELELTEETKLNIIHLCETFGYKKARRVILVSLEKYDTVIREDAINGDPFPFILETLQRGCSKDKLRIGVEHNIALLVSLNSPNEILQIMSALFEDVFVLLKHIPDLNTKMQLVRVILKDNPNKVMQPDVSLSYTTFLAQHFPSEVLSFLTGRKDIDPEPALNVCLKYCVYDACAFLQDMLGRPEDSFGSVHTFIERKVMEFTSDSSEESFAILERAFQYVTDFISRHIAKRTPELEPFAVDFLSVFAVPLFELEQKGGEEYQKKESTLSLMLRKLTILFSYVVPYPVMLKRVIASYSELRLELVRDTIIGVINDYAYDVDSTVSLRKLFREDELRKYDNFIKERSRGVTVDSHICGACKHPLLASIDSVHIFPCGHAFHSSCLTQNSCPICSQMKLDGIKPPSSSGSTAGIVRRLSRFENALQTKNQLSSSCAYGEISFAPAESLIAADWEPQENDD